MTEAASKQRSHWPVSVLSMTSALVNLLLPLALVRILSPEDVGVFRIFFLYLMIAPAFALSTGLFSGFAYWSGQGPRGAEAIKLSSFSIFVAALLLMLVGFAIHVPLAQWLGWNQSYTLLFAAALFGVVAPSFFEEAAIAVGRVWIGALFYAGFELARTLVILVVAVLSRDLLSIFTAHVLMSFAKVVCALIYGARLNLISFAPKFKLFSAVWAYALPVSFAWIFGVFFKYADQLILSTRISTSEFAFYSIGCLSLPPLFILEQSVFRVMIPQLAEAFARKENHRAAALYKSSVQQLFFLLIPAVFGLCVFAEPIIQILFTERYLIAAKYLQVFALSYLLLAIPFDAVARAMGQGRWILRNFVFFSFFALGLCYLLATKFGAFGALAGLLISSATMKAYSIYFSKQETGWAFGEFLPFGAVGRFLTVSLGLSVISLALRPVFASQVMWFFVCGGAFAASYLLIALLWVNLVAQTREPASRVLMLTQYLAIGGLEKVLTDLSLGLKRKGRWEVFVLTYDQVQSAAIKTYIPTLRDAGIDVEVYRKRKGFSFGIVLKIVQSVVRNDIQIIHSHDLGGLIYGALAKIVSLARVRLIHTQHSFVHLRKRGIYKVYERFFSRFADELVVVSRATKDTYVDLGVSADKVHVIENGVNFDQTLTRRVDRLSVRQRLIDSFPAGELKDKLLAVKDKYWILNLARLYPVKGQAYALKIWSEMSAAKRENCALIIVGGEAVAGETARLMDLATGLVFSERIVFTGASSDPQSWLTSSDLYLSCSEFEGSPLGPVEAIGSGLPTVLSKIVGHEFLDEVSVQFKLHDERKAATVLESLLDQVISENSDWIEQLASRAAWVKERFAVERMLLSYELLYEAKSASEAALFASGQTAKL